MLNVSVPINAPVVLGVNENIKKLNAITRKKNPFSVLCLITRLTELNIKTFGRKL